MITWQKGSSCTLHYPPISSLQSPNTHFLFTDRVAWSKIVRGWGEVIFPPHMEKSCDKILGFATVSLSSWCLRGLLWLLNSSRSLIWAASSLWKHWNPIQAHWSWVYLASRSFQGLLPPAFLPGNIKKSTIPGQPCACTCMIPAVKPADIQWRMTASCTGRYSWFWRQRVRGHLYNAGKECVRKCVFGVLCSEVMGHFRGSSGDVLSSSLHS